MSMMFPKPIKGYTTKTIEKNGEKFRIGVPLQVRVLKDYRVECEVIGRSDLPARTHIVEKATSKHEAVRLAMLRYRAGLGLSPRVAIATKTREIHHRIGTTV